MVWEGRHREVSPYPDQRPQLPVVGRTRPLAEAITLARHLDQRRVREKPIEDRRGGRDIAEETPQSCVGRFVISVDAVSCRRTKISRRSAAACAPSFFIQNLRARAGR